jgi:hypothetical protein
MTTVHAQVCGEHALVPRAELERLVELARKVEPVEFEIQEDDISVQELMLLAERGGAFDWLAGEPDLYSVDDLKVRYR